MQKQNLAIYTILYVPSMNLIAQAITKRGPRPNTCLISNQTIQYLDYLNKLLRVNMSSDLINLSKDNLKLSEKIKLKLKF